MAIKRKRMERLIRTWSQQTRIAVFKDMYGFERGTVRPSVPEMQLFDVLGSQLAADGYTFGYTHDPETGETGVEVSGPEVGIPF